MVESKITAAANCIGNLVIAKEQAEIGDELLASWSSAILKIGSPVEYIQQSQFDIPGLPEGGAKHLLRVTDPHLQDELAKLLCEYADVCPAKLPMSRPNRGLDDVHEIKLAPGT